jgi:hypothetical protein
MFRRDDDVMMLSLHVVGFVGFLFAASSFTGWLFVPIVDINRICRANSFSFLFLTEIRYPQMAPTLAHYEFF